jgi:hypothetical protein
MLPKHYTHLQSYTASVLRRQLSLKANIYVDHSILVIAPCGLVGGYQGFVGT